MLFSNGCQRFVLKLVPVGRYVVNKWPIPNLDFLRFSEFSFVCLEPPVDTVPL